MTGTKARPRFDDRSLNEAIYHLRRPDNFTNLGYLALDYLCLAATVAGAIVFAESRGRWGIAWAWNVPVFAIAIILVGGLQHRLAGLGHEASHYSLMKNKFLNDLIADLFCFFPIIGTVHFYRLFHMAHHQFTNDLHLDPDLASLGPGKRVDDFPMSRAKTILTVYLRALVSPLSFARYQFEYLYLNTLGKGNNVYMRRVPDGDSASLGPRTGTVLGLVYLLAIDGVFLLLTSTQRVDWLVPAALLGMGVMGIAAALLPERVFFRSPFRQPFSPRFGGVIRLSYYTLLLLVLAQLRFASGGRSTIYFFFLWILPVGTSFMFFMLLRDIYQHTNADDGRLTNSRVFFCDPLTQWAVFVHGQGLHIPHHLFPAVPHYRLGELHKLLMQSHADYSEQVVECHGTFSNEDGASHGAGCPDRPEIGRKARCVPGSRNRHDPIGQVLGIAIGIRLEFERVVGLRILDHATIFRSKPVKIGDRTRIIHDPIPPRDHEQRGLVDLSRNSSQGAINQGARRQQAGRGGSKAERIIRDELLALAACREQRGIAERNGKPLLSIREIGPGDS